MCMECWHAVYAVPRACSDGAVRTRTCTCTRTCSAHAHAHAVHMHMHMQGTRALHAHAHAGHTRLLDRGHEGLTVAIGHVEADGTHARAARDDLVQLAQVGLDGAYAVRMQYARLPQPYVRETATLGVSPAMCTRGCDPRCSVPATLRAQGCDPRHLKVSCLRRARRDGDVGQALGVRGGEGAPLGHAVVLVDGDKRLERVCACMYACVVCMP
jgi:hypothetical protein